MKKLYPVMLSASALFALRRSERERGFDPVTGLTVPTLSRYILIAGVILIALALLFHCRTFSTGRPHFRDQFAVPKRAVAVIVVGCFFLIGGGVWMGGQAVIQQTGAASLAAGVLAVATGGGFLLLTRQMRQGTVDSVAAFLPALFFAALWLLSLYLPAGSDPVLARYWLPILAVSVNAGAFAQLAGFCRKETRVRTFGVTARLAVVLSLAATAMAEMPSVILLLGCAVIFSVFIVLAEET